MTTADEMFQTSAPPKEDEAPGDVPRDRWDRPLIIPIGGGQSVPYRRASTIAGALDDKSNLGDWKARMAARGVARSPDLIAGVAAIEDIDSKEGKKQLNELVKQAQERAGASTKRTLGTAFHKFAEIIDSGRTPEHVPEALHELLTNYVKATRGIQWLAIEQFVVCDEAQVAGTADRVGRRRGQKARIWDIKTGRVDFGALKFAIQFAAYAHGSLYNPATGARMPWPEMDLEVAHVIHADPVTSKVEVYDVDIVKGWTAVDVANTVYRLRNDKSIMRRSYVEKTVEKTVMQKLAACRSLQDITAVYNATGELWENRHKTFASQMARDIKEGKVS